MFGEVADGVVTKITTRVSYGSSPRRPGESMESYNDRTSGATSHDVHIRFLSEDGSEVEFKTTSTFGHDLNEGDNVRVIYLPQVPQKAEIYSSKQLWLPMLTGSIVTFICLGGGFYLRRAAARSWLSQYQRSRGDEIQRGTPHFIFEMPKDLIWVDPK